MLVVRLLGLVFGNQGHDALLGVAALQGEQQVLVQTIERRDGALSQPLLARRQRLVDGRPLVLRQRFYFASQQRDHRLVTKGV